MRSAEEPHEFPDLEAGQRKVMDMIKPLVPAGVGVTVFFSEFGRGGGFAYASTCNREDMLAALFEFIGRQDKDVVQRAMKRARTGDR